jgi:ATP-dependent exoDNAse (exonuclease V) alpha subunit
VFLTGAAGAGKTYVLNQFIEYLKQHKISVGITASTGIAATHMQGMTIHSWSGIGIRDTITKEDVTTMMQKSAYAKRMLETKVLIIDEISMLHGQRLELVDTVMRYARNSDKPFGGVQVIMSGDLFQLPPVTRSGPVDWVFMSHTWREMKLKVCYLQEQHRQEDSQLLDVLNAVRNGDVEEYHQDLLGERLRATHDGSEEITRLYTHNADVDQINQSQLQQLETEGKTFVTERIKGGKKLTDTLIGNCLAPEVLELKLGSEVMFVVNNPSEGYVNGTRGRIVAFTDERWPIVVTREERTFVAKPFSWKIMDGEKVRAEIAQVPLRLAWAITVHKSQGMSLDAAEIDLSKAFEPGMGYVAISRVRSLDGLFLKGANSSALVVHPDIRTIDTQLQSHSAQLVRGLQDIEESKLTKMQEHVRSVLAPKQTSAPSIDYDETFFAELRSWRAEQAQAASVPSYVVFNDETLQYIASIAPQNEDELLAVKGVGPKKVESYGKAVLKMTKRYKKSQTTKAKKK